VIENRRAGTAVDLSFGAQGGSRVALDKLSLGLGVLFDRVAKPGQGSELAYERTTRLLSGWRTPSSVPAPSPLQPQ